MRQAGHGQTVILTNDLNDVIALLKIIKEQDFYRPQHADIYGRIVERKCVFSNLKLDPVRDQPAWSVDAMVERAAYPQPRAETPERVEVGTRMVSRVGACSWS